MYRLSYSLLLHEQDAEDVVQEVFVYVFRNLHQYDPKRGAFHTWLYTITVSRSRNARRRKMLPTIDLGQLLQFGQEPPAPADESPEAAAVRNDAYATLAEALKTLSPRLREAVVLRYGKLLTYKEMSAVLNCPDKTAESRVRLAHAALRKAMNEQEYQAPRATITGMIHNFWRGIYFRLNTHLSRHFIHDYLGRQASSLRQTRCLATSV